MRLNVPNPHDDGNVCDICADILLAGPPLAFAFDKTIGVVWSSHIGKAEGSTRTIVGSMIGRVSRSCLRRRQAAAVEVRREFHDAAPIPQTRRCRSDDDAVSTGEATLHGLSIVGMGCTIDFFKRQGGRRTECRPRCVPTRRECKDGRRRGNKAGVAESRAGARRQIAAIRCQGPRQETREERASWTRQEDIENQKAK